MTIEVIDLGDIIGNVYSGKRIHPNKKCKICNAKLNSWNGGDYCWPHKSEGEDIKYEEKRRKLCQKQSE